jgi:hypothetical protein
LIVETCKLITGVRIICVITYRKLIAVQLSQQIVKSGNGAIPNCESCCFASSKADVRRTTTLREKAEAIVRSVNALVVDVIASIFCTTVVVITIRILNADTS